MSVPLGGTQQIFNLAKGNVEALAASSRIDQADADAAWTGTMGSGMMSHPIR